MRLNISHGWQGEVLLLRVLLLQIGRRHFITMCLLVVHIDNWIYSGVSLKLEFSVK